MWGFVLGLDGGPSGLGVTGLEIYGGLGTGDMAGLEVGSREREFVSGGVTLEVSLTWGEWEIGACAVTWSVLVLVGDPQTLEVLGGRLRLMSLLGR